MAKEHKITDIVIGLRTQKDISDTFLGKLTQEVLSKCATTTLAYRPMQPMSTVKRYIVVIPENAEKPERTNKSKEQVITLLDILKEQ